MQLVNKITNNAGGGGGGTKDENLTIVSRLLEFSIEILNVT